jgi:BarA-like signal transduction histidine kinase
VGKRCLERTTRFSYDIAKEVNGFTTSAKHERSHRSTDKVIVAVPMHAKMQKKGGEQRRISRIALKPVF